MAAIIRIAIVIFFTFVLMKIFGAYAIIFATMYIIAVHVVAPLVLYVEASARQISETRKFNARNGR